MTNALRPIHTIAADIRRHWPKPYFGAVPYLDAMRQLSTCNDAYYEDSGHSVVAYFLGNAAGFKGEAARNIKVELKAHLKSEG